MYAVAGLHFCENFMEYTVLVSRVVECMLYHVTESAWLVLLRKKAAGDRVEIHHQHSLCSLLINSAHIRHRQLQREREREEYYKGKRPLYTADRLGGEKKSDTVQRNIGETFETKYGGRHQASVEYKGQRAQGPVSCDRTQQGAYSWV